MKRVLFISSVPAHPANVGNWVHILQRTQTLVEKGYAIYFASIASNAAYQRGCGW